MSGLPSDESELAGKAAVAAPLPQMEQNPDPGPVDKSVLVEQELHKSEAIFIGRGYKPIRFIEHGTRLNQWEVKHEGMLAILQRAGFYYLSCLKRVQLDHALLNALVERWRRETQTFHLRFGEMTVLLKDVAILAGLRVHGAPVTGPTDCSWEQLCLELLGQEPPQIKGGSISIAWLHDTFNKLPEGAQQSEIEYATRAYILYQIGCSLFPDPSGTRVHLRYLVLLCDFDASGEMAWGAAVLAHLYRELGKASMKGKANCCAFLTLLQIWAWEHIQIGRPERLENKAPPNDRPLGCRWNVPFKSRENVRSIDHEFYRHGIDTILDSQITWDPYTPNLIAGLPAVCTAGAVVWRSRTPLICFQIVEMHVPDRVLLQFGMIQHIPDPVEAVERVTMQGKADEDWSAYHDKYIKQWENRLSSIVGQRDMVNPDPAHARNCYLEWYWRITRRWISTPVERPVISYQSLGHSERALVSLVTTVQERIRRLLSGEIERKRVKESLAEIDQYITAEMAKAKHFAVTFSTSELDHLDCKQQNLIPSSAVVQLMPLTISIGSGDGRVKSSTITTNSVDIVQATVAKVEQVTDDYVEGNTILQLDRMRRIEPAGGIPDLGPPVTGVQDGGNNQTEEAHQQEDSLDMSMPGVDLPDIINTPVEDAMIEIINTSTEDATMEKTPGAPTKNGDVHQLTVNALVENVEVQETVEPMEGDKVQEKVTAELQESADAPSDNGEVQRINGASMKDDNIVEIIGVSTEKNTGQGTMNGPLEVARFHKISGVDAPSNNDGVQEITGSSVKDDTVEEIVDVSSENNKGQGTKNEPLGAARFHEISDASSVKNNKAKEMDAAPSGNGELEEAVDVLAGCDRLPETVGAQSGDKTAQEGMELFVENGDITDTVVVDPLVENLTSQEVVGVEMKDESVALAVVQKTVDVPPENLRVTDVEEKVDVPLEDAEVEDAINSSTREKPDALREDEPTTHGGGGSQDQGEISKRRKVAVPTQENAEIQATAEAANVATNAQTEEPIRRHGGSGSDQLIAFIRRKRKKEHMQSSP